MRICLHINIFVYADYSVDKEIVFGNTFLYSEYFHS